ncbi:hypothetical protein TPChic_0980a [Treponema pallidum subsp. pallidum str. Chicago]|nr:hypothetical protein TPChic_0980a [Treponema pallidum subsp. pallidum str. Chicago]
MTRVHVLVYKLHGFSNRVKNVRFRRTPTYFVLQDAQLPR